MSTQIGLAGSPHSLDSVHPLLVVLELPSVPLALIDPAVVGPPVGSVVASVCAPLTDELDPSAVPPDASCGAAS